MEIIPCGGCGCLLLAQDAMVGELVDGDWTIYDVLLCEECADLLLTDEELDACGCIPGVKVVA